MGLFRSSRAEDSVDRYNHTWAVSLLLLLSLTTWLLPLSPSITIPDIESPMKGMTEALNSALSSKSSKHSADCLCPTSFAPSMVQYMNSICGNTFDQIQEGKVQDNSSVGAKLFEIGGDILPGNLMDQKVFEPKVLIKRDRDSNSEDTTSKDVGYFKSVVTPLVLFILAMGLKFPHILWTLLSSFSGINIDRTLESVSNGEKLDKDSRGQLNQEIIGAISQSAKSTSYSTALMYLLFKFLVCAVAVGELVFVYFILLEIKALRKDNNVINNISRNNLFPSNYPDFRSKPLLCAIEELTLQNKHLLTVQCIFTPKNSVASLGLTQAFETLKSQIEIMSLDMYESLFTILMAFFIGLAITNALSLFIWIFKLGLNSCRYRSRVNSVSNLPLDVYLLLYMAQENIGHLAAKNLAEKFEL